MKKGTGIFMTFSFTFIMIGIYLCLLSVSVTQATVFVVDATVDDGAPDSLREAIEQANASAGEDIVVLQPGRYVLNMGQLEIQQDLTIQGRGADTTIIDGNKNGRVFFITTEFNPDIKVIIEELTITGGKVQEPNMDNYGGGIYNEGDLAVKRCAIIKNTVIDVPESGPFVSVGGGVYSERALTIKRSIVTRNTTIGDGSGAAGGGISCSGILVIEDSQIVDNWIRGEDGVSGGGIDCTGNATIINSQIMNNSITGGVMSAEGAGICIWGDLTISHSKVAWNEIKGIRSAAGGGIMSFGDLNILYSRITENMTSGPDSACGGGIFGWTYDNPTTFKLIGSKVTNNIASSQDIEDGGGIWVRSNVNYIPIKSIVRGNSPDQVFVEP